MPRFYNENSPAQNKALAALAATSSGCGYAGNIRPKVRMQTWDSLARLGLVRFDGSTTNAQPGVVVYITPSGREIADHETRRAGTSPVTGGEP